MTTLIPADTCLPAIYINPVAKTKRECHLETLLILALPYIEREELSTRTSAFTRHLLAEIQQQVEQRGKHVAV